MPRPAALDPALGRSLIADGLDCCEPSPRAPWDDVIGRERKESVAELVAMVTQELGSVRPRRESAARGSARARVGVVENQPAPPLAVCYGTRPQVIKASVLISELAQ